MVKRAIGAHALACGYVHVFRLLSTWPSFKHYAYNCLNGMRKTMENLGQCSQCSSRDSNQISPE
jgi:hypothetical protein